MATKLKGDRSRIRFIEAAVQSGDGAAAVRVRLERAGELLVGRAGNSATLMGDMRSAAEASLDALRQVAGAGTLLTLRDVGPVAALGQSFVLAVVEVQRARRTHVLLGVCPLSLNMVRDAALAVLDATNRVIAVD